MSLASVKPWGLPQLDYEVAWSSVKGQDDGCITATPFSPRHGLTAMSKKHGRPPRLPLTFMTF